MEATATTSLHLLRARLLHHVAIMRQDVEKRVKTVQRLYKGDQNKTIHNEQEMFYVGQYWYIDHPPVRTCAAERFTTDLYSKFKSPKMGLFRVVEILPSTSIDCDDGIWHTGSMVCITLVPTPVTVSTSWTIPTTATKTKFPNEAMQRTHRDSTHSDRKPREKT